MLNTGLSIRTTVFREANIPSSPASTMRIANGMNAPGSNPNPPAVKTILKHEATKARTASGASAKKTGSSHSSRDDARGTISSKFLMRFAARSVSGWWVCGYAGTCAFADRGTEERQPFESLAGAKAKGLPGILGASKGNAPRINSRFRFVKTSRRPNTSAKGAFTISTCGARRS
jgi:hypothetical protein